LILVLPVVCERFLPNSPSAAVLYHSYAVRIGYLTASLILLYYWLQFPWLAERFTPNGFLRGLIGSLRAVKSGEASREPPRPPRERQPASNPGVGMNPKPGFTALTQMLGVSVFSSRVGLMAAGIVVIGFLVIAKPGDGTAPKFSIDWRLVVLIICALYILDGVGRLHRIWLHRVHEGEVLVLTPGWPRGAAFKRLLLQIACLIQVVPWLAAVLVAFAGFWGGLLGTGDIKLAALVLAATSLAGTATCLAAMVRKGHKSLQWLDVTCWLCSGLGVLVYVMGRQWLPHAAAWSVGVIVIPMIPLLVGFICRPIRFPARSAV